MKVAARVLSSIVRMATYTPKTTSIKAKSTCDAILTKKVVVAQLLLKMDFFFENQPHTHPKNPDETQKIKIESKMKNEAQRTPLAPRDIYNSNITSSSIEVGPYAKQSSTMRKRRATVFSAVHL